MYPFSSNKPQMYPFVPNKPQMFPSPVQGTVEKAIFGNQSGRIKCLGSFWPAKLHQTDDIKNIPAGETVEVIGRVGNTLLVIPIRHETPESTSNQGHFDNCSFPVDFHYSVIPSHRPKLKTTSLDLEGVNDITSCENSASRHKSF